MDKKQHNKDCECESCWRIVVISAVDSWIEKIAKENPGKVCPFCGTNPSKPKKYGSGWKAYCGHEVRKNGLVIGWKKTKKSKIMKCINSAETKQLIFSDGKWRKS
jgi:hypothetical protein